VESFHSAFYKKTEYINPGHSSALYELKALPSGFTLSFFRAMPSLLAIPLSLFPGFWIDLAGVCWYVANEPQGVPHSGFPCSRPPLNYKKMASSVSVEAFYLIMSKKSTTS
jgi:hypothetical protein